MGYAFNTLGLLYELLKDQALFVTTEPPSDISYRLPALIISAGTPQKVTNFERPGAGATVSFTLTALAEDDEEAFDLCDSAYSAMWDRRNEVTKFGWIPYLMEVQAPMLVSSTQTADGVFQYTCVFSCVMRK